MSFTGPCYEELGMPRNEAREAIFNVYKHKYTNHDELKKVINEIITDKIEMCSYRGYWVFQHNIFKKNVQDRLDYHYKKVK